jgi:hypothetical protein
MQLWMVGIAPLPNGGAMTGIQTKIAVFYGEVDQKRGPGWYWTAVARPGEPPKGSYTGPFETKADAVEHAVRSGGEAALKDDTAERSPEDGQNASA